MNKEDLDSDEAILRMRKELDFSTLKKIIIEQLNETNHLVLATSANDRVTARTVDFANDGLILFTMSWEHNKKVKQIQDNPHVALCLNELQIEGKAEILGKPSDEKNKKYLEFYRKKFSNLYIETFTKIPTILLIKITPISIVRFTKMDRRFHFQKLDIQKEKAYQMRLEDKSHPAFPS